ncbi:hypothetical protein Val02_11320 [Virgisporangium aliadipatigenens]|uniref:Amino acid adenylation domain-containing protein n=1 Tax=Virgisporangium aliadipatigenens TaxID=741659 RepID=A0A8J4DNW7_9ACTN|nr:AMP-binding protein [Virgisporangium aliadipatigenens]GIJ44246.1 hypothetical protein Val02_11320 [Virgisporangium aliadipatigenens]
MTTDPPMTLWGGDADPPCLLESLNRVAARYPDRIALVDGDLALTYTELYAWVDRVRQVLAYHGVGRDDRVAVAAPRGASAVAAIVAVTMHGATYVPLDAEYPRRRLEYMLNDCRPALVLYDGERPSFTAGAPIAPVPPPGPPWNVLPASRTATHDDDLPVYVIYTSGSTGWPKGVALAHRCLDNVVEWQARFSPRPDLRTVHFAPLNFDVSFQEIFGTLGGGGTLVVMPERLRREPVAFLTWLGEQSAERLFLPYVALQMLALAAATVDGPLPLALVEINVAGEQLVCTREIRSLLKRLPGCRLVNHYGQSESAMVTAHVLGPDPDAWPALAPIGRPLPGCELLLDRDPDSPDTGELLVAGLPVSLGYVDRPALNAERYISVPPTPHGHTVAFRTGDLVRLTDGTVTMLTRVDDDIKLRGIRVNLAEIDAQLTACAGVGTGVCVVMTAGRTRVLRAAVVPRAGVVIDPAAVLQRLRALLPEVAVPRSVSILPELPRSPSGKISREQVSASIAAAFESGDGR